MDEKIKEMATASQYAGAEPVEAEDLGNPDDGTGSFGGPALTAAADVPPAEVPPVEVPATEAATETPEVPAAAVETPPVVETPPATESSTEKGITIPKSRFDQATARARAAENRTRELEAELAKAQKPAAADLEIDFGDAPKEMFDKVLDGQLDRATELFGGMMKKAMQAAYQSATADAVSTSTAQVAAMSDSEREDVVISGLEEAYGIYDSADPSFNEALVHETVAMQKAFISRGFKPAEAMQKAADYVIKGNGIQPKVAPVAVVAAVTPPPAPVVPLVPRPDAVARSVAAAKAQPPALPAAETDETPAAERPISAYSEEEFFALPESTRKRLRGDYV